jgi:hypothetical protein
VVDGRDSLPHPLFNNDTAILNSLPMPNVRLGERRTARSVYAFLRQHYGSGDYNSVANIETKLQGSLLRQRHRLRLGT